MRTPSLLPSTGAREGLGVERREMWGGKKRSQRGHCARRQTSLGRRKVTRTSHALQLVSARSFVTRLPLSKPVFLVSLSSIVSVPLLEHVEIVF